MACLRQCATGRGGHFHQVTKEFRPAGAYPSGSLKQIHDGIAVMDLFVWAMGAEQTPGRCSERFGVLLVQRSGVTVTCGNRAVVVHRGRFRQT